MALQIAPAVTEAGRLGDPQDGLQIAQAAWPLLAIRLQIERRILLAAITFFLLGALDVKEGLRINLFLELGDQTAEQRVTSYHQTRFDKRRLHSQIAFRLLQTILNGSHAMADLETDVPKQADQLLDPGGQFRIGFVRQQNQQINV